MAKAPAKPRKPRAKKEELTKEEGGIDPRKVHELLGIMAPLEPPAEPSGWPDWSNWWDVGASISTFKAKKRELFFPGTWIDGQHFAKASDQWKWKQCRIFPPDKLDTLLLKLRKGDELATAREVVSFIITQVLLTGEREEVRVRTRDKLPDLRRVVVSFTRQFGFDFCAVSDEYESPTLGLAAVFTPPVPRK